MTSQTMPPVEFFGKLAFIIYADYCGTPWRRWPFPPGPPGPPDPSRPPPMPWFERVLGNLHYAVLGGLVLATAVAHPKETFGAQYGVFMLAPVLQVLSGLYYSNVGVQSGAKVKA
ncbi:hypothetical protein F5882DRAFT_482724 [Hyaloscypha sp. PMI_1271]|nr:hypothetical protein F5882DRAFT_482724 [Hyaloscypha sp. PMI_1271]